MTDNPAARLVIAPDDEHNQALVAHVHPADWDNPVADSRYNLVCLGAGSAGLISAIGTAGLGGKVALVERHLMGGDCLNVGCVPSKALIASAHAAHAARLTRPYGVAAAGAPTVDFAAVMERLRRIRAGIAPHDAAARYQASGVDVFLGEGRFTGPDTLEVGGQTLRFARAVIATGARAFVPPIPGADDVGVRTNESIFELTELPARLAVVGAGPIGCELAQAFQRLGSAVTLLDLAPRILLKDDPDAADLVATQLRRDGVDLRLNAKVARFERDGADRVVVVDGGAGEERVAVDEILVAAGRRPNVDGIGLEQAGVAYTRHGVTVDDRLRTSNRRIYAAGDVASVYQFTHAADVMARMVIQNSLFWGRKKMSKVVMPWATYTDPEVAHVGLPHDALIARADARVFTVALADVDRAKLDGETEGFVRFHVDKKGRILGATVVARHAGDLISEVTLAMTHKLGLGAFAGTIHPYPTQAEVLKRAGDAYNRTRLTPFVATLLKKILAWRR